MTTEAAAQQPKPAVKQPTIERERTPIPIEKLIFTTVNPSGANLPNGPEGRSAKFVPELVAGMNGADLKIEIGHLPWLRVFRVVKLKRVTKTGANGKEIESFVPQGKPFHIPDSWAVSIPVDE